MIKDPVLKKYENNQDIVKHDWAVEAVGDEVVANIVCSKFSFTFNRSAETTWKYLKDFNSWMVDLEYSSSIGDQAEGTTIYFTIRKQYQNDHNTVGRELLGGADPAAVKKSLIVRKAVPGKVLLLEALSKDGRIIDSYYLFALHEDKGRTTVTGLMSHAPQWAPRASEEELREAIHSFVNELEERWKTVYIPRLRQLAEGE